MRIRGWFRFSRGSNPKAEYGVAEAASDSNPTGGGAFIDVATLRSFPGATVVASSIAALLQRLTHSSSDWIPATVAFFVGLLILYLNLSDKSAPPSDKVGAVVVGILNAFLLACAVLGVYRAGGDLTASK